VNRIESIFQNRRSRGERALTPFICGGRPSVESIPGLLTRLEGAGAPIVEVGLPFSDPIADGPVIAAAMHEALQAGVTIKAIFEGVAEARGRTQTLGLIAMGSVSIAHRLGLREYVTRARDAGFDGFIFPDAPVEEAAPLVEAAGEAGMTASLLIAPTTPDERAARIAAACSGFVYLLARAGITGETAEAPRIGERVRRLREATDLPIACGFGISTPDHVRMVVEHADAAIVGSALVRTMERAEDEEAALEGGEAFVRDLTRGLSPASATS